MKTLKTGKIFLGLICLIWILIIIISFTGCYTEKKAVKQATKAMTEKPLKILPLFREKFPCIITGIVRITDSTDYKLWKDSIDKVNAFYGDLLDNIEPEIIHDTTIKECDEYRSNEVRYKAKIEYKDRQLLALNEMIKNSKPIHDTVKINTKDSSEVKEIEIKHSAAIKERDLYHHKSDKRGKINVWLIFLVVGLLTPYVIRAIKFVSLKSVIK